MAVQWVGLWRRGGGRTTGRFGGMAKVYHIDSKNEDGVERFLCGLGEDDSAVHEDLLRRCFSKTAKQTSSTPVEQICDLHSSRSIDRRWSLPRLVGEVQESLEQLLSCGGALGAMGRGAVVSPLSQGEREDNTIDGEEEGGCVVREGGELQPYKCYSNRRGEELEQPLKRV